MKMIRIGLILIGILGAKLPAASEFSRKADALTPQNSGRVYEIGSKGFVVMEGKKGVKTGEKSTGRVVLFSGKSFYDNDLHIKSIASNAPSSTYEIDLLKYEF